MKKVVVASLLAFACVACVAGTAEAQTQVNLGSNQQSASHVEGSFNRWTPSRRDWSKVVSR